MADIPTTSDLFKAKAITDSDMHAAVDAYIADPSTSLFVMGEAMGSTSLRPFRLMKGRRLRLAIQRPPST